MDRSEPFELRLGAWIRAQRPDHSLLYEHVTAPGGVRIVEREAAGEAVVECPVPAGCTCIQWRLDGLFSFLKEDKNADGTLLVCRQDGRYEAHIIECKRTVDQTKWHEIARQFRWTLGKLLAIAGVLGIAIERVTFGTAYRRDQLSEDESPNPSQGRPMLEGRAEEGDDAAAITEARRYQLAWMNDQVRLPGFLNPFPHVKIRLDAEGRGTYRA
jgi:hypothetical protein